MKSALALCWPLVAVLPEEAQWQARAALRAGRQGQAQAGRQGLVAVLPEELLSGWRSGHGCCCHRVGASCKIPKQCLHLVVSHVPAQLSVLSVSLRERERERGRVERLPGSMMLV